MKRLSIVILACVLLWAGMLTSLAACNGQDGGGALTPTPTPTYAEGMAQVVYIVDGDTIDVRLFSDDSVVRVRYIGIDTPEVGECYYDEATSKNGHLLDGGIGGIVRLEKDVSETDQYGRLLRYVWVGDVMVNAELVRLGYALAVEYPPDTRYANLFFRLEYEAMSEREGRWADCPPYWQQGHLQLRTNPLTCDPAYPDVFIPPPPPALDCGDIPYHDFIVLPPDPHHFDEDGDGIGCES